MLSNGQMDDRDSSCVILPEAQHSPSSFAGVKCLPHRSRIGRASYLIKGPQLDSTFVSAAAVASKRLMANESNQDRLPLPRHRLSGDSGGISEVRWNGVTETSRLAEVNGAATTRNGNAQKEQTVVELETPEANDADSPTASVFNAASPPRDSTYSSETDDDSAERPMHRLTGTAALEQIRSGKMTVVEYATALLNRVSQRDCKVEAWAHLNHNLVLQEARRLDEVPLENRGPIHGLPIGVKDVIYTKDMPTEHNSPIYKDSFPKVDAASIRMLRHAGALIFGKTVTTEFAATSTGGKTHNPHEYNCTPGGSSSGSAAAVADFQVPVTLGTQTGGSMIRPASYNGIYALKPTWNSICRDGQKIFSVVLDTLGIFARSVDDLKLLANVFEITDDSDDDRQAPFVTIEGSRFAICRTMAWPNAGVGTRHAVAKAADILKQHGAEVEEIDLPSDFDRLPKWHETLLHTEGRISFLPEYRPAPDKVDGLLKSYVENRTQFTRRDHLNALDGVAALRPKIDDIAGKYTAILAPSVVDEAPDGVASTGSAEFCSPWSTLHTPVINIPGFKGPNDLPVGVSIIAPRFRDEHLLKVAAALGPLFVSEGGWKSRL